MKIKTKKKKIINVIGLDEAGRGSLAGPVVAVAVKISKLKTKPNLEKNDDLGKELARLIPTKIKKNNLINTSNFEFKNLNLKITDSKKISPEKRKKLCKVLSGCFTIKWGIGIVSEKKIDKINILESTKLAMKKALNQVSSKNDFLIIDGNFKINTENNQKSVVKADEKIIECSIASIIAKVKRDEIMEKYHKKYLKYEFDKNKGYGTKKHIYAIKKYGLCPIHRKTFKIKN